MALDVISIVIGWPAFGDIRNRSIGQLVSVMKMAGSAGLQRKRQTLKAKAGNFAIFPVHNSSNDNLPPRICVVVVAEKTSVLNGQRTKNRFPVRRVGAQSSGEQTHGKRATGRLERILYRRYEPAYSTKNGRTPFDAGIRFPPARAAREESRLTPRDLLLSRLPFILGGSRRYHLHRDFALNDPLGPNLFSELSNPPTHIARRSWVTKFSRAQPPSPLWYPGACGLFRWCQFEPEVMGLAGSSRKPEDHFRASVELYGDLALTEVRFLST
jgi:hypothetical protein